MAIWKQKDLDTTHLVAQLVGTGAILSTVQKLDQCIRVLTHERNQGYGAALADGFAATRKDLTFFMDSDGQFDIRVLKRFPPLIDEYDAVIGSRVKRQDTWMRRLNAWGWKLVVRLALGVRDIDCAFKLLHTDFLHWEARSLQVRLLFGTLLGVGRN